MHVCTCTQMCVCVCILYVYVCIVYTPHTCMWCVCVCVCSSCIVYMSVVDMLTHVHASVYTFIQLLTSTRQLLSLILADNYPFHYWPDNTYHHLTPLTVSQHSSTSWFSQLMWHIGVKDIKERLRVLNLLVLLLPDVHQAVLKVSFFYMYCVPIYTVTQLHTVTYMFYYMTIYHMLYVSNELTMSARCEW